MGPLTLGRPPVAATTLVLAIVATVHLGGRFVPYARATFADGLFAGLTSEEFFPRGAVEFLRLNPRPARLWHPYTWGGYLAWHLPERRIFIDGRGHLVYPIEFLRAQSASARGEPDWEALLDRWAVSVVVWPSGLAGGRIRVSRDALLASPDWIRIYDDRHSAVFAHAVRGRAWVEAFRSFALRYPETPAAQLFLADTHLVAGHLDRGHALAVDVLARWPEERPGWQRGAERVLARARREDTGLAWLQAGFSNDVLGEPRVAAQAYRAALARGIPAPSAAWVRTALARLSGPRTRAASEGNLR